MGAEVEPQPALLVAPPSPLDDPPVPPLPLVPPGPASRPPLPPDPPAPPRPTEPPSPPDPELPAEPPPPSSAPVPEAPPRPASPPDPPDPELPPAPAPPLPDAPPVAPAPPRPLPPLLPPAPPPFGPSSPEHDARSRIAASTLGHERWRVLLLILVGPDATGRMVKQWLRRDVSVSVRQRISETERNQTANFRHGRPFIGACDLRRTRTNRRDARSSIRRRR